MIDPTNRNCSRNCFLPAMCGLLAASAGGGLTYGASKVVEYLQKDVCKAIFDPSCVKGTCLNNALEDCHIRFKFVPVATYTLGAVLSAYLASSVAYLARRNFKRREQSLLPQVGIAAEACYPRFVASASILSLAATGMIGFGLLMAFQGSACDNTCKVVRCSFDDRCAEWVNYNCAHNCKNLSGVVLSACMPIFLSLGIAIPFGYFNYKLALA